MRTAVLVAILLLFIFLDACTRPEPDNLLALAGSLMLQSSDSSLLLIQTPDQYFIFQVNDTLTTIAVQYHDSLKDTLMQTKAYICRGYIHSDLLTSRKESEYQSNLKKLYCCMALGVAVFLFLLYMLWMRHRKRIGNLQKEIARHDYSHQQKNALQEELHTMNSKRQALLKEAYEHSEVYVKMNRIIQSYKKTDRSSEHFDEEDWRQLIAETDLRHNNITIRLAAKYPLSLDEIYLCCLYLTDIPTSHFRYILQCSRDSIYKKTKRILEVKMQYTDKSASLRDILQGFA